MRIELLPHAERQLQERNIRLRELEETLKHPLEIVESRIKGRKIAQKIIEVENKKFLYRVVFNKEKAKHVVITAYRTTKLAKYLKEGKL